MRPPGLSIRSTCGVHLRERRHVLYGRAMRGKAGIAVFCLAAAAVAGEPTQPKELPLLSGSNSNVLETPPRQLLTFHGSMLLNPFVYGAVINLPEDAGAN